jgi:hypothetical protein
MLGLTTALIVARPWYQSWGSTAAERAAAGAGRELAMGAAPYRIDRAVTVQAPARLVWAWLAQMGQDRAGFYSFEGIERAVGLEIRNSDSLVAHWQQRSVGELVRAAPPGYLGGRWGDSLGWRVTRWDPPRTMTLEGWGDFVVTPIDDSASRLRIHTHAALAPSVRGIGTAWLGLYLFEPAHFVMERAMLTGIKRRAEGVAAGGRPAAGATSDTHGSTAR